MTVKEELKQLLKNLRLDFFLDFLRHMRKFGYFLLDILGWVFFGSFVYLLRRRIKLSSVKKILIIRLDRVGDLILSTPAIRAVRESYPDSKIDLLVGAYTKDLVVGNANVNRVLVYGQVQLGTDYDLAIALHPGLTQNYVAFKSGAALRAGYTGWGGGFYLTHRLKDDRALRLRHEVVSALEIVSMVGCGTKDTSLDISLTESGDKEATDFLYKCGFGSGERFVVVHPGSRQEYIRWHFERFAKLSDRIIKECGIRVVLTGGPKERELIVKIKGLMQQEPCCALDLSLSGVVSLIKRARLFVGNCTGPMHIASALHVPVVAIIGTTHPLDSPEAWGPWDTKNIIIHNKICSKAEECHPGNCATYDCMDSITIEEVFQAVVKLLSQ